MMKTSFKIFAAVAMAMSALAGSARNTETSGAPTVFEGRFIGYGGEYVETNFRFFGEGEAENAAYYPILKIAQTGKYDADKDFDKSLVASCENALKLEPGAEAPDIEMLDLQGNVHHLAEFRGRPLYVDLWASWCGPCCAEIPYLAALVEALGSDPDIVCISISIDDDRNSWIAKLEDENPSWPQFLASAVGQESVSNVYNVAGIPRFLLIDADGRIASLNAPRPSSPNIIEKLKSLL